jgi:UDP-glucose 4-epimerase
MGARRFGDVAKLIANSDKALEKLGWKTTKSLN